MYIPSLNFYLLAQTESYFNVPRQARFPVKCLQRLHTGVSVTARNIAMEKYRCHRFSAIVVVVAALHGHMTRTLKYYIGHFIRFCPTLAGRT